MGMSRRYVRKHRRRANAKQKFGEKAVRKHNKIAGRTGSIHQKKTKPKA